MRMRILEEEGQMEAVLGMSLSYGAAGYDDMDGEKPLLSGWNNEPLEVSGWYNKQLEVSRKLAVKDGGHNKFLESIAVWMLVEAPRYWWQQFDTYRAGITKQSESTMHTLMKRDLTQDDFEGGIDQTILDLLNGGIHEKDFDYVKRHLPESFLQTRVVCTNYKALRNIIRQRRTHKLPEWKYFIEQVLDGVIDPEYLREVGC